MTTKVKAIPDGYHSLSPYLIVKGASAAIDFYKKALGATELYRLEMGPGMIGHAEMQVGNSRFMLADESPEMKEYASPPTVGGTPVSFMLYVEDADFSFEKAVAAGVKVLKPLADQFYGDRSGTFVDPYGHMWTVATHKEDVSPEEMKSRMEKLYGGK